MDHEVGHEQVIALAGYRARRTSGPPEAVRTGGDRAWAPTRLIPAPLASDPGELFRRALVEGDEGAWVALCAQYQGLVRAWLRRHPAATLADETEDFLVNRTFERFWRCVGPERFGTFEGIPSLLCYLKLCAQSVLLDDARARARHQLVPLDGGEQVGGFEDAVAEQSATGALWRAIGAAVRDESELLVARLSFIQGLKPREIHERYPERYGDIAAVYRVKRNLLDRLRRDETIRAAYEGVAPGTPLGR